MVQGPRIIDPNEVLNDPETQARIEAAVEQANLGSEPDIPEPSEACHVELPAGWVSEDGILNREAEVRELTGEDEEALAKVSYARNPAKFVTTVLTRAVIEIAGQKPDAGMIKSLLVGDRDYLMLAVRRASFGDEMDMTLKCPFCDTETEVVVDLHEEVPVKRLEDGRREWIVELNKGRKATVVMPNGFVQEEAFSLGQRSQPEVNTDILSGCVRMIDDLPVVRTHIQKLSVKDRRTLLDFIQETAPGPDLSVLKHPCSGCARESNVPIDIADLFRS